MPIRPLASGAQGAGRSVPRDGALPQRDAVNSGAHCAGPSAGRSIGEGPFRAALKEYYGLRGWNENGVPTEEKLQELGIDYRLEA